jgi:hypothetical protein
MRLAFVPLALALAAAPGAARADAVLQLARLGDAPSERRPSAHLELPPLDAGGLGLLRVDDGAGARGGSAEPALALILGIIPGFGLGHLVANSPRWTTWLIVDIALLAVWIVGSSLDVGDPLNALFFVALVVERVFEGVDAFRSAGGRFADAGSSPPAWALARPVRDPATATLATVGRW